MWSVHTKISNSKMRKTSLWFNRKKQLRSTLSEEKSALIRSRLKRLRWTITSRPTIQIREAVFMRQLLQTTTRGATRMSSTTERTKTGTKGSLSRSSKPRSALNSEKTKPMLMQPPTMLSMTTISMIYQTRTHCRWWSTNSRPEELLFSARKIKSRPILKEDLCKSHNWAIFLTSSVKMFKF